MQCSASLIPRLDPPGLGTRLCSDLFLLVFTDDELL